MTCERINRLPHLTFAFLFLKIEFWEGHQQRMPIHCHWPARICRCVLRPIWSGHQRGVLRALTRAAGAGDTSMLLPRGQCESTSTSVSDSWELRRGILLRVLLLNWLAMRQEPCPWTFAEPVMDLGGSRSQFCRELGQGQVGVRISLLPMLVRAFRGYGDMRRKAHGRSGV